MNIIDYVRQVQDTFAERPLSPVDSLVLSQLSYCKFEYILENETGLKRKHKWRLKDFCKGEYFDHVFADEISDKENRKLFLTAVSSRRFRNLVVRNIVSQFDDHKEQEKQFAAMIFELDNYNDYVAFRGTDGSLLGWKEDFNLSFMDAVPSHKEAVRYINQYYLHTIHGRRRKFYLGGHSKGGNIATYAGLMCSDKVQSRIIEIYSHDGPGFKNSVAEKLDFIQKQKKIRIKKTIPQTSMIGILLESNGETFVVKSNGVLIMQHSAYNWQIKENDFEYLDKLSQQGFFFNRTIREWLQS